jgi:voltage-gated sodium channel
VEGRGFAGVFVRRPFVFPSALDDHGYALGWVVGDFHFSSTPVFGFFTILDQDLGSAMTDTVKDRRVGLRDRLRRIVEAPASQRAITVLILFNAVILALETSQTVMAAAGDVLTLLDHCILAIFVAEIALKLIGQGRNFFRDPWNLFDTAVIAIALVPATESLSVLRALRILRVLRLISAVPSLRRVVGALLHAVPGMGSVVALLSVIYFVFSVMATKLFGGAFPEWFGDIGGSAYSLFQIMTLESWSMGIVRPVMEVYPLAWIYFVPFILITSFAVLNLFIGIMVDAMQTHAHNDPNQPAEPTITELHAEIQALRGEIADLSRRTNPDSSVH